jgi:D-alanyl-D-alanine carboxypeptidase (penicillin-binding protein 5/6)
MLWQKGVSGIKTGVTSTAGPCLITSIKNEGCDLIIVLLGCKSMEARWLETNKLANWTVSRLKKIEKYKATLQ